MMRLALNSVRSKDPGAITWTMVRKPLALSSVQPIFSANPQFLYID